MSESAGKGLFSRIFGGKKPSCCDVRIEEVTEEVTEQVTEEATGTDRERRPSCCGGPVVAPKDRAKAQTESAKHPNDG